MAWILVECQKWHSKLTWGCILVVKKHTLLLINCSAAIFHLYLVDLGRAVLLVTDL